jgi:hypothetical protein
MYKIYRYRLAIHHKAPRLFVDVDEGYMILVHGPLVHDPYQLDYEKMKYTERLLELVTSRERLVEVEDLNELSCESNEVINYVLRIYGGSVSSS